MDLPILTYIYISVCVCMCVCVFITKEVVLYQSVHMFKTTSILFNI